eukprot:1029706-Prymnesium_polylepis.1
MKDANDRVRMQQRVWCYACVALLSRAQTGTCSRTGIGHTAVFDKGAVAAVPVPSRHGCEKNEKKPGRKKPKTHDDTLSARQGCRP